MFIWLVLCHIILLKLVFQFTRILSVCRSDYSSLLSSFVTYHRICIKNNTTDVTSIAETVYPYGTPEFTPCFFVGSCYPVFNFLCIVLQIINVRETRRTNIILKPSDQSIMDKSHKTQDEYHSKTIGPINNGQVTQNTGRISF